MAGEAEIEIARKLFAAWSSGDPDAPEQYLTPDAVLYDIVEGEEKVGWTAIREFFARGLKVFPDLVLLPDEFWVNEKGVAVRWHMSASVPGELFGPESKGKKWHSDGMSYLDFRDGKVSREGDYHHGGAPPRSLEES